MARPILRRFDKRFFRNLSASDLTQVPAKDARIDLYRQGATTSEAKTIGVTSTPVNVYDPGDLHANDVVTVGFQGPELTVVGEPSPTQVQLKTQSGTVSVPLRARLIPRDQRPTLDPEPLGHAPNSPTGGLLDPTGAWPGYISYPHYDANGAGPPRLDYVLSGTGLATPRLYLDALAGMSPSPSWLNARDFANLYEAIDATPEGGALYLPGGLYEVEKRSGSGLVIAKPGVTLIGDGPLATIIRAKASGSGQNPDFDLLTIEQGKGSCQLRGIQFDGAAVGLGTRSCIVLNGAGNFPVQGCLFEDLIVGNASQYGLLLKLAVEFRALNCVFQGNRQAGARATGFGTTTRFFRCGFKSNGGIIAGGLGSGIEVAAAQATLVACTLEDNVGGVGVTNRGCALDIRTSSRVEVMGCYFVSSQPSHAFEQYIYCEDGPAALVSGCWFDGSKLAGQPNQVKRAARFVNSWGARFSSNVAIHLAAGGAMVQFDATQTPSLSDSIEYGNREWDYASTSPIVPPRIIISNDLAGKPLRVFSLSRGVVQVVRYANEAALPDPTTSPGDRIPLGSMVWLDSVPGSASKLGILSPDFGGTWRRLEMV